MNWSIPILTERLELHPFAAEDAAFFLELVNTPGWLTFIGDRQVHTMEAAEQYIIKGPVQLWKDKGYGPYVARERVTGEKICYVGWVKRDFLDSPDMGYACLPKFHRMGYVHEANEKLIELARKAGEWQQIYAITLPENLASIGVLTKLGFTKFDSMIEQPENVTVDIYSLSL
jgi:[ribosomal protein S5]-alanine N-acetyltransferase